MFIAVIDISHGPFRAGLKMCVLADSALQSSTTSETSGGYLLVVVLVVPGSLVGELLAYDLDEEGTRNAQLTYTIESQSPDTTPSAFSIDDSSGRIQLLRLLHQKDQRVYNLNVRVSDPGNTHAA